MSWLTAQAQDRFETQAGMVYYCGIRYWYYYLFKVAGLKHYLFIYNEKPFFLIIT